MLNILNNPVWLEVVTTSFLITRYDFSVIQILQRYDMVLVQEIRDASGVVIPGTLARLNAR